jgi:flagellar hook-associated protein 3 FlgL
VTTNLDPVSQLFLANVNRIQNQLNQASQEVSSGKKVTQASDAPDQVEALLQLRSDQQHNQQIESNLTLAQTNAQAADSTLGSAIQLMDKAVELGTEGANSASNGTDTASLSQQVGTILDEMVSYSQTVVGGQYIFSGDQSLMPTYEADPTAPEGVDQLSDAPATAQIENPAGGSFPAGLNAQQIFDARNADGTAAAGNVFAALSGLETALASGDAQSVASAVDSVQTASAFLNQQEAVYGQTENRIQDAQSFSNSQDTQLQSEIGQIQDADIPSAAIELTQTQMQLQACFEMESQVPHKTLFDYLG